MTGRHLGLWLIGLSLAGPVGAQPGERPSVLVMPPPSITSLTPNSGGVGTAVTIAGNYFWSSQGNNTVTFGGVSAGTATSWSNTSITVNVPKGATTGNVVVTANGVAGNGVSFTVIPAPTLTSVSPGSGVQGASVPVTLTGTNFVAGATVAVSNPGIAVGSATVVSATQITATLTIGAGAATGAANVTVTTSGGTSGAAVFMVNAAAASYNALIVWDGTPGYETNIVAALTNAFLAAKPSYAVTTSVGVPASSLAGYKQVWDVGSFDITPLSASDISAYVAYLAGGGSLFAGGSNATGASSRDASMAALVFQAGGGTITPVNSSNVESVLPPFTTTPDAVTSITFISSGGSATTGTGSFIDQDTSPADGIGTGIVWPLGTLANATSGNLIVVFDTNFIANTGDPSSVAYLANLIGYLNSPPPFIASLTPNSGSAGTSVTVAGGNFGATQGTSTVKFSGTLATAVTGWSSTSITVNVPNGAATGNVVVTVGGVASNGANFAVLPPAPVLTSVSPASGVQGTIVPVTLTGANFVAPAAVAVSNPGVTVGGVTVVSATQITATLTIGAGATTGAANVTVTTSGGTSGPAVFTVNPAAPVLTSVSPGSGVQGTSVPVTLTGANFVAPAAVAVSNPGVTVGGVTVASATQITATLTIGAGATTGAANVTVITSGGTSGTAVFTVNPPAPVLTSVSPASGVQGTSVPVTLTGTNFVAGATVAVGSSGVTVSNVTVTGATQITATFAIAANAATGTSNVTVTTSGGTSGPAVFTVNPAAPVLTSVSPGSGVQGTSVPMTLTGANFVAGATVAVSNPGIAVGSVTVVSATQITATLTIDAGAATGAANVTVTTSGGTSGPAVFAVNPPAPTLTSVSPASGVQGAIVPVTLTGANFVAGATVAASNPGIAVGSVTVVSATQITATLTIDAGAATGAANVTVATSGGTSGPAVFTVNPPAPVLTSVSPASGVQGAIVPVTLTGSNFVAGAAVAVSNPGVTVGSVTVVSSTQIATILTIGATAATGAANITVTTSGGTSSAAVFTVNPSGPTLTSVSPASGVRGTSVPVTITGANFAAGATVGVDNAGVAVSAVSVVSGTQITATFAIAATAAPGAANVTVTNSTGTSNAVVFTVVAMPSITSVSPATAAGGAQVTVSGLGFGAAQGTGTVWLGTSPAAVVSWSDTQIVATVASNAQSGNAVVQQGGVWSNTVPFTVITPTISTVTPTIGLPGDSVTIAGSGFGATQGNGQVWLGTVNGVVQSWSDTQIVALVGAGAASGNAQVLQNGVMSNAIPFTVNTPQIASISPTLGAPGTQVTFTGTGFGANPGSVTLGNMAGNVVSWQDTQVVATVAAGAVSGIARVQSSGGLWSNALLFTVPASGGGGTAVLMPSLLNMVVGDTRTLQALGPNGQTVKGLAWTSSDPTVVGLSSDDPPVLTAVAAGHATITAGTGSADVTVWAGALPVGTAIWSNPGDGSGVSWIVPAVPSPTGVADVFAIQNDQTVQAIAADGTVAWTADVSQASGAWRDMVPDFQGGLVVVGWNSIWKLDGMTGQPYPAYTPFNGEWMVQDGGGPVVHPDGTIFAAADPDGSGEAIVGIDPTTGTLKFSVPVPHFISSNMVEEAYGLIVAGDGYAYFAYSYPPDPDANTRRIGVLRISSSGANDNIDVYDVDGYDTADFSFGVSMITNADQGILLTWGDRLGPHMATITGTALNVVGAPQVPGDGPVTPVLQAQDGSFFGTLGNEDMVAFDAGGGLRWLVPNETPQIATADGGVIGASGTTYDAGGNATGSVGPLPTYSWLGNAYQDGPVEQAMAQTVYYALSWRAAQGGNQAHTGTAEGQQKYPELRSCNDKGGNCAVANGAEKSDLKREERSGEPACAERLVPAGAPEVCVQRPNMGTAP
jgi:hypothetical protein